MGRRTARRALMEFIILFLLFVIYAMERAFPGNSHWFEVCEANGWYWRVEFIALTCVPALGIFQARVVWDWVANSKWIDQDPEPSVEIAAEEISPEAQEEWGAICSLMAKYLVVLDRSVKFDRDICKILVKRALKKLYEDLGSEFRLCHVDKWLQALDSTCIELRRAYQEHPENIDKTSIHVLGSRREVTQISCNIFLDFNVTAILSCGAACVPIEARYHHDNDMVESVLKRTLDFLDAFAWVAADFQSGLEPLLKSSDSMTD